MGNMQTIKEFIDKVSSQNTANVIYGAGWMGKLVYRFLESKGIEIAAFIETVTKDGKESEKIPVYGLDDFLEQNISNINFILAVKEPHYRIQMEKELKKRKITSYYMISEILQYRIIREIIKLDAGKELCSTGKNRAGKTVGYLNTTYLGADYAHERLICFQDIFEHPEMIKKKGSKSLERIRRMHDPKEYQKELAKNLF